jgi:membrane protease YdiL (CAAX protease family)
MMTQHPTDTSQEAHSDRRTDPTRDRRRLAWYFGVLITVYVGAIFLSWPSAGDDPNEWLFPVVMYAPLVGALFARYLGPGVIQWGRPSWWILAAAVPPIAVLGALFAASAMDLGVKANGSLQTSVAALGGPLLLASLLALGEEVGWRGFLWPLLRNRYGFLLSSFAVGVVWLIYHVPFVLLGWYGTVSGLPAFTLALAGFTLFVGVITDRSRSVWPSVVAHGAWNALVATTFAVHIDGSRIPAFSGTEHILGEFGWLPAVVMAVIGAGASWWHLNRPAVNTSTE